MRDSAAQDEKRQPTVVERYYRFHSHIYDATRWSFLFGRTSILQLLGEGSAAPARILEVGCGTGKNLVNLCRRFPHAKITGVDLSPAMLEVAKRKVEPFGSRVELLLQPYDAPLHPPGGFDSILFSYALSMFNPGFENAIQAAHADLADGGHIAVVDFHDSRWTWFERWMGINHVRMNGQLRPKLLELFDPKEDALLSAYGGVWRYLRFVGTKR